MDNDKDNNKLELLMEDVNYEQLVFRHIDRIQNLLLKDHKNKEDKLFYYNMGVQGLVDMIPKSIRSTTYKNKVKEIRENRKKLLSNKKMYSSTKDYELIRKLFHATVNLLSPSLFKYIDNGEPDE